MALNATILTTLILERTEQRLAGIDPRDPANGPEMDRLSTLALAEAIIEHIQAYAEVAPGIPVSTSGMPPNTPLEQTGATTSPGVIQ
ncbi:MAG: hypothetical protein Q8O14_05200 [bacterium]|nr:hypothetical protein [bacterium]